MVSFNEAGFLADDLRDTQSRIRHKYGAAIDLLYEINTFAHGLNDELLLPPGDTDKMLAGVLHARMLSFAQAYVITIERGMIGPAHLLLRQMLRTVFALVAIGREAGFAKRYLLDEQLCRFERLNTLLTFTGEASDDVVDPLVARRFVDQFDHDHGDGEVQAMTVEEVAVAAGMEDWYATAYTVLADSVYAAPQSLDAALLQPDGDEPRRFTYRPATDGLSISLFAAAKNMLNAIAALSKLFDLDSAEYVRDTRARVDQLEQPARDH